MGPYLSTGEFAKLCSTTKDTLLHYDKVGLLKPHRISGSGYRQYLALQFFEFDAIAMLQETGSSLAEAKAFLHLEDEAAIREQLLGKKRIVEDEIARLQRRRKLLENLIDAADHLARMPRNALRMEDAAPADIDVEAFPSLTTFQDEAFVSGYARFIERYAADADVPQLPFGVVVPLDGARSGCGAFRSMFCMAGGRTLSGERRQIPGGRYARFAYYGPDEGFDRALQTFVQSVEKEGLRAVGDLYVFDLMTLAYALSDENCLLDFAVRVQ